MMPSTLSLYIADYTKRKIPPQFGPLDENGIPLFELKFVGLKGNSVYHPTAIIQYGLAHHTLYQDGNEAAKIVFLKCAGWLENNAIEEPKGRFLVWNYSHHMLMPPISPPWISGMAQGQGLSLLMRAYQHTNSSRTADIAWRAALSYLYDLNEGGILSKTAKGNFFIEEYAFRPAIHVLNGCLYSLIGLYEFLQVFPDPRLQEVMLSCIRGIEEVLPSYDLGWWSRYSACFRWNLASFHYHEVHINLLSYLGELFDSSVFRTYAFQWKGYQASPWNRFKRKQLGMVEVGLNRILTITNLSRFRFRKPGEFGE